MMRLRHSNLIVVVILAAAQSIAAQSVTGRVLMPDSASLAPGIVVMAIDDRAATVARTLSNQVGAYVLRLPKAGRYTVRAIRIGFKPTGVSLDVGANEARKTDIVLLSVPTLIARVDVVGHRNCGLAGPDADTFLQLWEQARAALAAVQLSQESGRLDLRVVRILGQVNKDGSHAVVDSERAGEVIVDRLFADTPAETLAISGYVRVRDDSTVVYDVPSAEVLLSDDFLAQHCFKIETKGGDASDWIGIQFSPIHGRDAADITGTLWLDRTTAELRRMDYGYTNLRPVGAVCRPASGSRPKLCAEDGGDPGAGGRVWFVRLASGTWLTSRWIITTPAETVQWQVAHVYGPLPPNAYDRRPRKDSPVPRLGTTDDRVVSAQRDGDVIYSDDTATRALTVAAAARAGGHPATLEGIISDASGRPLGRATVEAGDPTRAAITNALGFFRISLLPGGPTVVSVRRVGYQAVSFRTVLIPDATRRAALSLAAQRR